MTKTSIGTWIENPKDTIDFKQILNHTHIVQEGVPKGCIMFWDLSNGNIPNGWSIYQPLLDRYPCGSSSGKGNVAEPALPNITGKAMHQENGQQSSGCFKDIKNGSGGGLGANDWESSYNNGISFDASRSSSIYKNGFNSVRPPTCYLVPIIKN